MFILKDDESYIPTLCLLLTIILCNTFISRLLINHIILKVYIIRLAFKVIVTARVKLRTLQSCGSQSVVPGASALPGDWMLPTDSIGITWGTSVLAATPATSRGSTLIGLGWVPDIRAVLADPQVILVISQDKNHSCQVIIFYTYTKGLLWYQNTEIIKTSPNICFLFFKEFRYSYMYLYVSHQGFYQKFFFTEV